MAKKAAAPPVAALRMEKLAPWVIGRVEDFPRKHRFTVGDRWIETCIDIQTDLIEANNLRAANRNNNTPGYTAVALERRSG